MMMKQAAEENSKIKLRKTLQKDTQNQNEKQIHFKVSKVRHQVNQDSEDLQNTLNQSQTMMKNEEMVERTVRRKRQENLDNEMKNAIRERKARKIAEK